MMPCGSGRALRLNANPVPLCGKQATEAAIDSQSVKSAAMVSASVGWDGGKLIKGRKRVLTVDTLGWVLRVWVRAASMTEREGGKHVLKKVKQRGKGVARWHSLWADGGFDGAPFRHWVMDVCRWSVQVVLRPEQTKGFVLLKKGVAELRDDRRSAVFLESPLNPPSLGDFECLVPPDLGARGRIHPCFQQRRSKKRWVVERTFGWLMGRRRLVRDDELLPETSETLIYLAMIRIMVRRLA